MKHVRMTLAAVTLLGCTTAIAYSAGQSSELLIVPFAFPTFKPTVCANAVLDVNAQKVENVKMTPVTKNGVLTGCQMIFSTANKENLKPPFTAKFINPEGAPFTVSSSQLASTTQPTAPIPGGWNRVRNTEDVNPVITQP